MAGLIASDYTASDYSSVTLVSGNAFEAQIAFFDLENCSGSFNFTYGEWWANLATKGGTYGVRVDNNSVRVIKDAGVMEIHHTE